MNSVYRDIIEACSELGYEVRALESDRVVLKPHDDQKVTVTIEIGFGDLYPHQIREVLGTKVPA